ADGRQHFQGVVVWLVNPVTEEFDDTEDLTSQANRKTESAMQSLLQRERGAGKIGILNHIVDPARFAGSPNSARQSDTALESRGARLLFETFLSWAGAMPNSGAAKPVGRTIDLPDGAGVPIQAFANRLDCSRAGFVQI